MRTNIEIPKLHELKYPKPVYPWPSLNSPFVDQLFEETQVWYDEDYTFLSPETLKKYKRMKLHDAATRMSPRTKTIDQLRPVVRYMVWVTVFDDYYECCPNDEFDVVRERIFEVMMGAEPRAEDNGIFRQVAKMRDEFAAYLPSRYLEWLAAATDRWIRYGMQEEVPYKLSKSFPTLRVYECIREYSIGLHPYSYMTDPAVGYALSKHANEHPAIYRLRELQSRIIGFQNDFHSLPKEVLRETEVFNLVFVVQNEYKISFEEACVEAMRIHDADVAEFIAVYESLKGYTIYSEEVDNYVYNMGIMIEGLNAWYQTDQPRYDLDGYVENEYVSPKK
jgi:hypothetical protein